MSLYPSSPRSIEDDRIVLDDMALAQSVTKAINDTVTDVFQKVKGTFTPGVGKENRPILFIAFSRGSYEIPN
jgi:hypothetical protein